MRTLIALALFASAAAGQDEAPRKRFLELNPGYRERAGGFYERTYLDPASGSLAKTVAVERFTKEEAARVLKQFIYDFLDGYIDGGGEMCRAAHAAAVKRADEAMKKLLDDEAAFKRWTAWRDTTNREENALAFITSAKCALGGLRLTVPDALAKAGWTQRVIEDDDAAATHKACFPAVPHQVFVFEKGKEASLTLLVYTNGRADELLAVLDKAKADDVHVFWRTQRFVVFATGTGSPESLKESLRRQLARQN